MEEMARYRRQRGLSKRALARRAGVSPMWVVRAERGDYAKPRIGTLRKVAAALSVPVDHLRPRA